MFEPNAIRRLANQHRKFFHLLKQCEDNLNGRFVNMEQPILALILAVAGKVPLIFVGPPGTAKSWLIRSFCGLLGILDIDDLSKENIANGDPNQDKDNHGRYAKNCEDYFEYLLTPFTEPAELFGFYDLAQAARSESPKLVRMDKNSLQKAKVIYLDEVFNGSSAILNTLLAIMNEGLFHDRGQRIKVARELFFGATNGVPERPELRAFYDRFVLRCFVDNMEPEVENLKTMLVKGFVETHGTHKPLGIDATAFFGFLRKFHEEAKVFSATQKIFEFGKSDWHGKLTTLLRCVEEQGKAKISNRRLLQMVRIMMIHAVYRVALSQNERAPAFTKAELMLFPRFFLDDQDPEIAAEMERIINDRR